MSISKSFLYITDIEERLLSSGIFKPTWDAQTNYFNNISKSVVPAEKSAMHLEATHLLTAYFLKYLSTAHCYTALCKQQSFSA